MSTPEEKYGQKIEYDPLWKGPMQTVRFATDRIWLIIFVLYIILYIFTAIYGFHAGDYHKIAAPTDHAGRICGIDSEVQNKSYLQYLDIKSCVNELGICESPSACLSQCPTENFIYTRSNNEPLDTLRKKLICTTDVNVSSIISYEQIDILMKNKKCAKWYLKSESVRGRCLVSDIWEGHESETITKNELYQIRKTIKETEYFFSKLYFDFKLALYPVLIAVICGGIIALACVILLRWFAIPFFYASIATFCAFLVYVIYTTIVDYSYTKSSDALFKLIFMTLLVVGIIIAVIYFRKKIYLACQLIKESSKAVAHLSSTLLFPIIPWILYVFIIVITVLVFMSLLSITVPNYEIERLDNGTAEICKCEDYPDSMLNVSISCDPDTFNSKCKTPNGQPCLLLQCRLDSKTNPTYIYFFYSITFFGLYWFIFFISGFEYMVLGGTFASWYWTFNKKNIDNYSLIESLSRTTRYHLGSIAVGSLILTISQMIRLLFRGLQQNFRQANNAIGAGFFACCRSIYDFIDSFINFLNYNAYIMCAIHGKSFVQSAKNAFHLIMRNVVKVVVVSSVADCLFVIVRVLIAVITVSGIAIYYGDSKSDESMSTVPEIAIILTAVGTYLVASVFFSVQSVAVHTIFLCFLEDSERNDGTEERPYFMSDKLKRLLHK